MPAVAAPADKRFRRAHVKPGRRNRVTLSALFKAARTLAVLAVVLYGAWRGRALVLGASALHVNRIAIHGNERLSRGEVLGMVDGLEGEHLLGIGLDGWRDRLLAQPWVAEATLRRILPGTVDIVVRERRPMAIARIGNRLHLVDASGVIIDEYGPAYADIDLPIVDGLGAEPRRGSPAVDHARADLTGRLLAALGTRPDLAARVSQIEAADARNAVVMLEGDTAMLRLGDRDFVERIQSYIDLAPALRERVAEIDYVDLRFDERVYVRPAAHGRGPRD
ncbi:MAG: FtsQ-type POTRA domain-containing protein [Acidobacteria bacterium]|nr:FtsQ-type POTRA domain-containing protein [Acidobacteriota bacterium]